MWKEFLMQTPSSVLKSYSPQLLNVLLANLNDEEHRELQEILELEERHGLWDKIVNPVSSFEGGPLLWLTEHTMTEDTHWMTKGTPFKARFPKKEYIRVLMEYLLTENSMLVTKSREMMASWTVTGYISWSCMTQPLFWIAQTAKQ